MNIEERYVAIDNVCAWPNLTHMPDGSILATIFNQPTHGGWEGDVECWISEDGGRVWKLQGVPAPHEPATNRMNVAAGLAHNGDMVVLASGWSNRNAIGNYSQPNKTGEVIPMWACRSKDQGKTWEHAESIGPVPSGAEYKLIPFGDIVRLPGNQLGACIYSWSPDDRASNFYVSDDDGLSWNFQGMIANGMNETTPLVLEDGRIIVTARTLNEAHLEQLVSEDCGKSWTATNTLTMPRQMPGHLLQLQDGRILLTYGMRNQGLYGLGARISEDQGKSWLPQIILLDYQTATDGGYPSSIQLDDGTIVTAYYCNKTPAHHRYHMGVIHWNFTE